MVCFRFALVQSNTESVSGGTQPFRWHGQAQPQRHWIAAGQGNHFRATKRTENLDNQELTQGSDTGRACGKVQNKPKQSQGRGEGKHQHQHHVSPGKKWEEPRHCLCRPEAADAAPTPARLQGNEAVALGAWRDTEA